MITKKGYTLVELIVIIAIIGILFGIIFVVAGPVRKQAKDTRIKSSLLQIQNRAERIYLDGGKYDNVCDSCPGCDTEICSLGQDIANQGGSLNITFKSPYQYCAYSELVDPSSGYFCVDSFGYRDIVRVWGGMCDAQGYCGYSSCADVNGNGVVECGFYPPDYTIPITEVNDCPDPETESGEPEFQGGDTYCVLQCMGCGTELEPDIFFCPEDCGSSPCDSCGSVEECVQKYDMDLNKGVTMGDVLFVLYLAGEQCPL